MSAGEVRNDTDAGTLLYHLKEIVEQESTLRLLVAELVATPLGCEARAKLLSKIEVEVLDHLGYHLDGIRAPLASALEKEYGQLEEPEG
jgi:hypothetical protein